MPVDPDYLRHHHASLSDEALLEINRADLIEQARQCYDEEVSKRPTHPGEFEQPADGEKPSWLEESSVVFSLTDRPGAEPAPQIEHARKALEAAGIPCYVDVSEQPDEEISIPARVREWNLKVPGKFNLHAASVLDRDLFNADFEAEWKIHLEMLSDEEFTAMDPKQVFCGLFDRAERVTRAYNQELSRRGLESNGN